MKLVLKHFPFYLLMFMFNCEYTQLVKPLRLEFQYNLKDYQGFKELKINSLNVNRS